MRRNIVTIVNFIRGTEPRANIDLLGTVEQQIRVVNDKNLPATWLIQYDALVDERFVKLLTNNLDVRHEIGVWFEIVQPLVERAGLTWRGRHVWDWEPQVGFSVGYTPEERARIIDVLMEDFRSVFGHYPRSVGSWFMDAHSLGYLSDQYNIVVSCNCKDQWGTDGYTLWGGYYNQAYYPSRRNSFMPAQHVDNQIPVPVFRMLGSDPIYQYDLDMFDDSVAQGVVTLEPVYKEAGGSPDWVRWFFDNVFGGPSLSFGYTQVGQENSFGWEAMKDGFIDQISLLDEKVKAGELAVETLASAGIWFRERYGVTPTSATTAVDDWKGEGRGSIWYYNRYYRLNLLWEKGLFSFRDIHLFDETYTETYLEEKCESNFCKYDTLPVVDGARWSDAGDRAGIYPVLITPAGDTVQRLVAKEGPHIDEVNEDELQISWNLQQTAPLVIRCRPDMLSLCCDSNAWGLELRWSPRKTVPIVEISEQALVYDHNHYRYDFRLVKGRFESSGTDSLIRILPDGNEIIFTIHDNATLMDGERSQ